MKTTAVWIAGAAAPATEPATAALDTPAAAPAPRRRLKLWQIPAKRHCALIGTCLPTADLRKLAERAGLPVKGATDFQVHSRIVAQCEVRSVLTESLQRLLEKRFAAAIARFSRLRDAAAIGVLWREALAVGDEVPGALWAAWTHPQLDFATGDAIFGDIHMLSHQVGASVRCDLRQLERQRKLASELRETSEALRRILAERDREHARVVAALQRELDAARQRAAQFERQASAGAGIDAAQHEARHAALQRRAAALAARAETLEDRNAENARRVAGLENEIGELRGELAAAEAALASALGVCAGVSGEAGCGRTCPAEQTLSGRCVLCVGGRSGLVDGYRRLVEAQGGRFLHHDGGQEESLQRIDAALASADAVVCQAGCVSHAAYWRLKETCKKLGKPCVFVKSPGVGSFARGLGTLAAPGGSVLN